MQTILIVIHLMVVLALVGVVLLQRSEGGGLGIGGGSGFMTARGAANALTRATAILAVAFFATSLGLSILARYQERPTDILDRVPASNGQQQQTPPTGQGGVLDQLGGSNADQPQAGGTTPPAAAPTTPPVGTGVPSTVTPPADTAPAPVSPSINEPVITPSTPAPAAPAAPTGQ